jgi:hypothetical protein
MMPGFAGPVGTLFSTDGRREGVADSTTEDRSSGVGGRLGTDDRVRGRFEEEEGSSDSRGLLADMSSRLDEAN